MIRAVSFLFSVLWLAACAQAPTPGGPVPPWCTNPADCPDGCRTPEECAKLTGNKAPSAPSYLSPASNGRNVGILATLRWSAATDPDEDVLTYVVKLGTDPDALDVVSVSGFKGTSLALSERLRRGRTYYWQVTAQDPGGLKAEGPLASFRTKSFLKSQAFKVAMDD